MEEEKSKKTPLLINATLASVFFILVGSLVWLTGKTNQLQGSLTANLATLTSRYEEMQRQYQDFSFESHLSTLNAFAIEQSKQAIQSEYDKLTAEHAKLTSDETQKRLAKIESVFSIYTEALEKIDRNKQIGLSTDGSEGKIPIWGEQFLDQKFDRLKADIVKEKETLDNEYDTLLALRAAQATPTPTPAATTTPQLPTQPSQGYSVVNLSTEKGTFTAYVIKMPLSSVRVKTVSANKADCANNCPAKSLQDYVFENNGFAGINGSYFCPPDYATCATKTYQYDFPLYRSASAKWINESALWWNNRGLITFTGATPRLFTLSQNFDGSSVTAGIANFPTLVANNEIVTNSFSLTSYQQAKGYRGAIGYNATTIFLAISPSATVTEMAYVMKALGATNALNLDGGGSSALYYEGSYKIGPGRLLPNAVILTHT